LNFVELLNKSTIFFLLTLLLLIVLNHFEIRQVNIIHIYSEMII
jgi:hypothetical protein